MIDSSKLFENKIVLYIEPNYFIIKLKASSLTFSINKQNKKIESNQSLRNFEGGIAINGVVGIIEAETTHYLVVITRSTYVGTILRSQIFKVEEFKFYPFVNGCEIISNDLKYTKMFQDFLSRNNLYYSDRYDLTNSIRRYFNNVQSNSSTIFIK